MVTQMKEEKTIFIRCSSETNDLLEAIRKAEMPHRSRNSEIIYLIHREAKKLGINPQFSDDPAGKAAYSSLMPVANPVEASKSSWSWDGNGSPIEEEKHQFNKDYGDVLERAQKHITEEETTVEDTTRSGLGGLAEKAKQENQNR